LDFEHGAELKKDKLQITKIDLLSAHQESRPERLAETMIAPRIRFNPSDF
jgi:hypothetical protein